jgi:protein yyaA
MTQKGIAATTRCDKHDGCLEYIVRIPVSSDGTAGKVENGAKEEEGEFEVKV